MSPVEHLREFVNKRLTAAAEEIFGVFTKTIVEYEEEIDRQRRLLDIILKPEVKLQRIELPQQHVCREEEEKFGDQQLCNQERNSSLDQEDREPSQIKEEQEKLCISQEGEHLVLKLETDTFMLTPTYEESDHQLFCNNPDVAESRDQNEGKHRDFGSTGNTETNPKESHHGSKSHINNVNNTKWSEIYCNAFTGKSSFKCDTCGKAFKFNSNLIIHQRIHTGEKPFLCKICGKDFSRKDALTIHMRRAHTGEKPYLCKICGKRYFDASHLAKHRRSHTDDSASTSQCDHAQ